jgi:hypothetical protein
MSRPLHRILARRATGSEAGDPGHGAVQLGSATHARAARPGRRERGALRRRGRYLRQLRELQLRDLGGLVFDLYRFGERREALVREKLDALIATDKELRRIADTLHEPAATRDVRQPGVGGTCAHCGAFFPSDARFCSQCGGDLAVPAGAGAEIEGEARVEPFAEDDAAAMETGVAEETGLSGEPWGEPVADGADAVEGAEEQPTAVHGDAPATAPQTSRRRGASA